jgi:hypothetical protein
MNGLHGWLKISASRQVLKGRGFRPRWKSHEINLGFSRRAALPT